MALHPLLKRSFILLVVLVLHFTVSRSVRSSFFAFHLDDIMMNPERIHEDLALQQYDSRLIKVNYMLHDQPKPIRYKLPFGFFFILAISVLILRGDKRHIYILLSIHGALLIISALLIRPGLTSIPYLMFVIDLLTFYLTPLASIGVVVLSFMQTNKQIEHAPETR